MSFQCISIEEAKTIIDKDNLTIIDIRDRNSRADSRGAGSSNPD